VAASGSRPNRLVAGDLTRPAAPTLAVSAALPAALPAPRPALEPSSEPASASLPTAVRCRIRQVCSCRTDATPHEGAAHAVRLYDAAFTVPVSGTDNCQAEVAGSARVAVVPAWNVEAFEALDRLSWDLSVVAQTLQRWADTLAWLDPPRHAGLAVVESVEVQPRWRGRRIGQVATALLLDAVGVGLSGALLFPMTPGLSGPARAVSHGRLTTYWARLGFQPWAQGHLAVSLTDGTLSRAVAALPRPGQARPRPGRSRPGQTQFVS